MTNSKHTPGPWVAECCERLNLGSYENYTAITLPGFSGLTPIALVPTHERAHTARERDANARLDAAAPEMLEALLALEAHCINEDGLKGAAHADDGRRVRNLVRAAIAKARGAA